MPDSQREPLIIRSSERFRTDGDGISTRHTFSFGAHYDPERIGYGPIMAINTERIAPGAGYDLHRHVGVDIVTCVVEGALAHGDTVAGDRVITAGELQLVRAASGVEHTERNASLSEPLEFVQVLLRGDATARPEHSHATGMLRLSAAACAVRVTGTRSFPASAHVAVHCVRGTVRISGSEIAEGDGFFAADTPLTVACDRRGVALVLLLGNVCEAQ